MAIIKADFEGAIRLAEISADELTVFHLRQTLAQAFDKLDLDGFDLHYLDDNDGPVLIDSDEEFLAGLCENGSPFRISVVPRRAELDPFALCGASLTQESGLEQHQHADADDLPVANLVLADDDGEDEDDDEDDEEEEEEEEEGENEGEGAASDPIQQQLFVLATQRIRERSPILKNLAASQLQTFMETLQLPLKKLVKADLLSRDEVCLERKRGRFCRRRGGRREFQALPSGAEQALRNAGLTLSDDEILTLVNVLHVQPRRFKKLGLCDASVAAHEDETGVGKVRLFELAASRMGIPISAENLTAFMQLLQLPVKRLMKAGLVSQKEFRGTGRKELTCTLAKDRTAQQMGHHSPKIMQALHEQGLFLEPPVVHHLMARLAISPRRFAKLGLIEPCSFRHGGPHSHGPHSHHHGQFMHGPPMHMHGRGAAHHGMHQHPHHGPHHGPHHFGGMHSHHGAPMHGPHHFGGMHQNPHHGPHHGPHHFGGMHSHHGAPMHGAHFGAHGPHHFGEMHQHPHHGPHHAHGMHRWAARAADNDTEPQRFPNNAAMARIIETDHHDAKQHVQVGTAFQQHWKVQNMHNFTWPASVQLVSDNDDSVALGVAEPIAVAVGVHPEQMVDITVAMTAPRAPGLYRPAFRLRDANTGLAFGQRLRADVLVTGEEHVRPYRGKRAGGADY